MIDAMQDAERAAPSAPVDWLGMAREAYTSSSSWFDASVRKDIENDIRQFQGQHPAGSKYHSEAYKARSRLFRPKTRAAIRKNEAVAAEALFSTQDVVSVRPADDSNPKQRASAALMQELLQWRLTKSIPWFLIACGAYQDAQTVGVVVSHQHWEYDARKRLDRPVIELLPIENLRIDPAANWADPINTSPYVIHLMPMYVKDVKARMNRVDEKTGQPVWHQAEESQILAATKPYGDTTRLVREGGRQDSKDQASGVTAFTIVWVHRNIVEADGQDWLYYTLGTEHLLSEPVPLEQVYHHGKRPYVMGFSVLESHKTYPGGVARLGRDTQAEINDLANLRIDNIRLALNKRYFVKRNKQVDLRSLTRNTPGSATLMDDPEKDVVAHTFPDVTGSSFQEHDRLNLDFDDVTGAFSQSSVQANRKLNETVGGMNILTDTANQVSGYQLRTFVETWVEPVLRQVVELEKAYETDDARLVLAAKQIRLLEEFGIAVIDDELIEQDMTINVNVGIGATNPSAQMQQFLAGMEALRTVLADGMLERYGLKVDEVIREIFGKLGYKDGGRFFDLQAEDPALTAARATISELQQALAAKTDPALVAKQIEKLDAEIQKIKADAATKNVEGMYSATETAKNVATVPGIAGAADAMWRSAGGQDHDAAPAIPDVAGPALPPESNTNPLTPANPAVGMMEGIETAGAGGV